MKEEKRELQHLLSIAIPASVVELITKDDRLDS